MFVDFCAIMRGGIVEVNTFDSSMFLTPQAWNLCTGIECVLERPHHDEMGRHNERGPLPGDLTLLSTGADDPLFAGPHDPSKLKHPLLM